MVLSSEHEWLFVKLLGFKETSQICVLWVGPHTDSEATPSDWHIEATMPYSLHTGGPTDSEGGANLVTLRSGDTPEG